MTPRLALIGIKLLHSIVWLFFAACIVAIPFAGFVQALWLSAAVLFECAVLACNRGRCPLTAWAARYTLDRADNFDIYLPLWLARYNKAIFGTIFVAAELLLLVRWLSLH